MVGIQWYKKIMLFNIGSNGPHKSITYCPKNSFKFFSCILKYFKHFKIMTYNPCLPPTEHSLPLLLYFQITVILRPPTFKPVVWWHWCDWSKSTEPYYLRVCRIRVKESNAEEHDQFEPYTRNCIYKKGHKLLTSI